MATMTLLQMTQSILSSMGSDEVNSIGDTNESLQVANIVQQTYYNMGGRYCPPEDNQLSQLVSSNNLNTPVLMTRPSGTSRIEWVKYFDTNPADGNTFTDQYGSYSHDLNTDLQNNQNGWATTSTTTNTIAVGAQTFTIPAGLSIAVGNTAFCYVSLNPEIYMSGTVTGYSGTTLNLNITATFGTGSYSLWNLSQNTTNQFGPGYKDVPLIPVDQFINMTNTFNPSEPDVFSFDLNVTSNVTGQSSKYTFYYKNDRQPMYCCIISNYYVIFDSFDNTQDSTLQSSKTMTMTWGIPNFVMEDGFVPIINKQTSRFFLQALSSCHS